MIKRILLGHKKFSNTFVIIHMTSKTLMTSLSLKLLTSSKMNKTIYHLKALIKIY